MTVRYVSQRNKKKKEKEKKSNNYGTETIQQYRAI
jgi:hypothetical protein